MDEAPEFQLIETARQFLANNGNVEMLRRWGVWEVCVREAIIDAEIEVTTWTSSEDQAAWDYFRPMWENLSQTQRLAKFGPEWEVVARQQATRLAKIERFKEETWGAKVADYFLKRKAALDKLVYSLIRHQDLGFAWELYFRLQEKEATFAELASRHSQGQERLTGGTLGPVSRETPHPALGAILSELKPGEMSPPRKLGEWFVVVRLDQITPATLDTETRRQLMTECFETWVRERLAEFVGNQAFL